MTDLKYYVDGEDVTDRIDIVDPAETPLRGSRCAIHDPRDYQVIFNGQDLTDITVGWDLDIFRHLEPSFAEVSWSAPDRNLPASGDRRLLLCHTSQPIEGWVEQCCGTIEIPKKGISFAVIGRVERTGENDYTYCFAEVI